MILNKKDNDKAKQKSTCCCVCSWTSSLCLFLCNLIFISWTEAVHYCAFLWLFGHTPWHVGSLYPNQGSNPDPLHWEHWVLTTGLLQKSSVVLFSSTHVLHINFELNFFRPRCAAFGIEPADPAEKAQSLNHWATRKVPEPNFIDDLFFSFSGECNFLMYPCSPKDCGYIWMYFQIMS